MSYIFLGFFATYYFTQNYALSFVGSFLIFILKNTEFIKSKCNCGLDKPQA